MNQVRFGIVGCGNMGFDHAKKILAGKCSGAVLTALCDTSPTCLARVKEDLKEYDLAYFENYEDLFASKLIDAVIVAVPHFDHAKIAISAFAHGLHVMSEKPAGAYTRQVREMNEAADRSGKKFGMMFQQRVYPAYRKIREIVHSGQMGEIRRTNWLVNDWYRSQVYYDSGSWRATWAGEGGGVLLNQCPHNLDLWQWICGMPNKVRAFCHIGKWHDIEVEDDVTAYVEYPNGATGTFITSTGDYPGTNRLEIDLDKGKIVYENNSKLVVWENDCLEQDFTRSANDIFATPKSTKIEYSFPTVDLYHMKVLEAFVNAILHDAPMIADGREGICSLTLSNAMLLSTWSDSTITLPLDEDLFYNELQKRIATSKHKTVGSNTVTVSMDKSFS